MTKKRKIEIALEMKSFLLERIKNNTTTDSNNCWIWKLGRQGDGYGTIHVDLNRWERTVWTTHRLIFLLYNEDRFDDSLLILHKCNNKLCCNIDHLYQGTDSDNQMDSVIAGTHNMASREFCKNGHRDWGICKRGNSTRRYCRECNRISDISSAIKFAEEKNREFRKNHG